MNDNKNDMKQTDKAAVVDNSGATKKNDKIAAIGPNK